MFSSGAKGDCFCASRAGTAPAVSDGEAICSARAARALFSAAASFTDESYMKYIAAIRRITPITVFFLSIFAVVRAEYARSFVSIKNCIRFFLRKDCGQSIFFSSPVPSGGDFPRGKPRAVLPEIFCGFLRVRAAGIFFRRNARLAKF